MFRGLFIDSYSTFLGAPPRTSHLAPLGVLTFLDEHLAYCNVATTASERLHRELLFGNTVPPAYFETLLTLKGIAISDCDECLAARWVLHTTYTEAYPEHPISDLATPRCLADALLALAMEGEPLGRQLIGVMLAKACLRTPFAFCAYLH